MTASGNHIAQLVDRTSAVPLLGSRNRTSNRAKVEEEWGFQYPPKPWRALNR